jgi:hypothetical protein
MGARGLRERFDLLKWAARERAVNEVRESKRTARGPCEGGNAQRGRAASASPCSAHMDAPDETQAATYFSQRPPSTIRFSPVT